MIRAMKRNRSPAGAVMFAALVLGAAGAMAQQGGEPVPDSQSRPGENLTDRLERTEGVIKPPPIDAPMPIEPPEGITRTPVIKPPIEQQTPEDGPAAASAGPPIAPPADSRDCEKPDGSP